MKKILLFFWDLLHDIQAKLKDTWWIVFDFFYSRLHQPPQVAGVAETVQAILDGHCSIARFGDGEIKLVAGRNISFQNATPFAVQKLREVLSSDTDGLLIGLADIFGDQSRYKAGTTAYWQKHLHQFRRWWYRYLHKGKLYYNASMTRQYIALRNKSESAGIFRMLQQIWDGRDVVFIEGEKSRMGVGNDLFSNAKSIRRILGPATQAFSRYDELLKAASALKKDVLILLALGPCATGLAYDLHKMGYQAVDIGHIDVEYEWMKMGAKGKMPVKNKMVFEASGLPVEDAEMDPQYEAQIIVRLT